MDSKPQPTILAIFGGSGDLTWRKLVPSLFDLFQDLTMPPDFSIVALDRIELNDEGLRRRFRDGIEKFSRTGKVSDKVWARFAKHIYYRKGDFTKPDLYSLLKKKCEDLENEWKTKAQIIYYMATPPVMFGEIPKHLKEAGMTSDVKHTRIVIEKPIGYDLVSALKLNQILTGSFAESQIYRIDHYLGKETVQIFLHSLPLPDAYETLLWDLINNDATLFMRADQVEAAWKIIMPVLDAWSAKLPVDFPNYDAGTWGPEAADGLLVPGHSWPLPTELTEK